LTVGTYTTTKNGEQQTVQFTDGDVMRDVADLYSLVEGEYNGTPSIESDQLKGMLADLQANKPLSDIEWGMLNSLMSKYQDKLQSFRDGPDDSTQGWVPVKTGGTNKIHETQVRFTPGRVTRTREAASGTPTTPNTGAMVALYPSTDVAKQIAQADGEDPDDLHLTLAFLGPANMVADASAVKNAVGRWATQTAPLTGSIVGVGVFTNGPDAPVIYASPDLPALPTARESLVDRLSSAGAAPLANHGFIPHITLDYPDVDPTTDDSGNVPDLDNLPLVFDHVALVLGDQRWDFPLSGRDTSPLRLSRDALEIGLDDRLDWERV
jgi:2'-5' RNA ligase